MLSKLLFVVPGRRRSDQERNCSLAGGAGERNGSALGGRCRNPGTRVGGRREPGESSGQLPKDPSAQVIGHLEIGGLSRIACDAKAIEAA